MTVSRAVALALAHMLAGCGEASSSLHDDPGYLLLHQYMLSTDPHAMATSATIPCIGTVESDSPIRPRTVAFDLILARHILNESEIVPYWEFCSSFSSVSVHVFPGASVDSFGHSGQYNPLVGTVDLDISGYSLLHELLHVWDLQHWTWSGFHYLWDTNGYDMSDSRYKSTFVPFTDQTP